MPDINITINPSVSSLTAKFGNLDFTRFLGDKIKELAFLVEREAKLVTPVDTGRLRASIRVMSGLGSLQQIVQPNVDYAIYVHEGTRYMKSRPFMFWGAETASKDFGDRINGELESWIQGVIR
jgi:hypothetical protein